jgi:hypothetical protein
VKKHINTSEYSRSNRLETRTYQKHHDYKNPTLHALDCPIWTTDTDFGKEKPVTHVADVKQHDPCYKTRTMQCTRWDSKFKSCMHGNTVLELSRTTWAEVLHDPNGLREIRKTGPQIFLHASFMCMSLRGDHQTANPRLFTTHQPLAPTPLADAQKHTHATTYNRRSKKNRSVKINACTLYHAYIKGSGSNPESIAVHGTIGAFSTGGNQK